MKKKWIVLWAALLVLSVSGCGGAAQEETDPSPAQTTEASNESGGAQQDDVQSMGDAMKENLEEGYQGTVSAGGTVMEFGGTWPDYELLSGIPQPSVGTVSTTEEVAGVMAGVMLVDMTADDCKEYAKLLPAAGFDQNVTEMEMTGVYSYSADNSDGLHVDCGYVSESVMIQVSVIAN